MRASVILCVVVAVLLGVSAGGHAAPLYTFTTIDRPGAAFTEPVGILLSAGGFSTIERSGRSLQIRQTVLGSEHAEVAESLKTYADLLRGMNRTAEAAEMEARAQTIDAQRGRPG